MSEQRPKFPADDLRAAVPGDAAAHRRIDALDREWSAQRPNHAEIQSQVGELRKHASLATIIANWFEDPKTQAFIDELSGGGL